MSEPRIVGISLLRNEDRFVEQVVRNAVVLCDELIVLDHASTDETPRILDRVAAGEPRLTVHRIEHPSESHAFVSPYAGERAWVFSVDGDELFDPAGLAALRPRVLAGEFDEHWLVSANTLHCTELDPPRSATGYLSPPSRRIWKLANFAALESWDGPAPERLHGGTKRFRDGFSDEDRHDLSSEHEWDDAPFRLLHACFVKRSSTQRRRIRPNPSEVYYGTAWERLKRDAKGFVGLSKAPLGKQQAYMRGEPVTVDATPFFRAP